MKIPYTKVVMSVLVTVVVAMCIKDYMVHGGLHWTLLAGVESVLLGAAYFCCKTFELALEGLKEE